MKYKVWMEIEAVDDDRNIYETVSPFSVCLGEFDSAEEADRAIIALTGASSMRANWQSEYLRTINDCSSAD
jgi:hypothetical protein